MTDDVSIQFILCRGLGAAAESRACLAPRRIEGLFPHAGIFLVYTSSSIASTFLVTAGTFGAMSAYGLVTSRPLDGLGSFAFMGLIGVILASVVNLFLRNSMLEFVISCVGVIVFVGLTAYDTRKLKIMAAQVEADSEAGRKGAIQGALSLYLDFINLFLMLLRLFGNRR